jgi:TPR repeat protein
MKKTMDWTAEKLQAWLEKAGATGMPVALHECGVAYLHGIGTSVNEVKALAYFRLATDNTISFGYNWEDDINDTEAVKFLKALDSRMSAIDKAAGESLAKKIKAEMEPILDKQFPERRESRLDEEKNRKEFERILALAKKGDAEAQCGLYSYYWNGLILDITDRKTALSWLNKSAEQGYYLAQVTLAEHYETGLGFAAPDLPKAVFWYNKAVAQGNAQGMYNLGRLYEMGRGVEKDEMEAFAYYLLAVGVAETGYDYPSDDEAAREKVASYEARLSPEARRLCLTRAAKKRAEIDAKFFSKKNFGK